MKQTIEKLNNDCPSVSIPLHGVEASPVGGLRRKGREAWIK